MRRGRRGRGRGRSWPRQVAQRRSQSPRGRYLCSPTRSRGGRCPRQAQCRPGRIRPSRPRSQGQDQVPCVRLRLAPRAECRRGGARESIGVRAVALAASPPTMLERRCREGVRTSTPRRRLPPGPLAGRAGSRAAAATNGHAWRSLVRYGEARGSSSPATSGSSAVAPNGGRDRRIRSELRDRPLLARNECRSRPCLGARARSRHRDRGPSRRSPLRRARAPARGDVLLTGVRCNSQRVPASTRAGRLRTVRGRGSRAVSAASTQRRTAHRDRRSPSSSRKCRDRHRGAVRQA